jgi:putative colanic acid biosynthesis acetyltransferase WcaF
MTMEFNREQIRFLLTFGSTFLILYGFNIVFIGLSTKPGYYSAFLHDHLNYIELWRSFNIKAVSRILQLFGYRVVESTTRLAVYNHGGFNLVYSCLGYGLMSGYTAFVISYPPRTQRLVSPGEISDLFISYNAKARKRGRRLVGGLMIIQLLNLLRFLFLAIFWNQTTSHFIDHHLLFTFTVYGVLIYFVQLGTKTPRSNDISEVMNTTQLSKAFRKPGFSIGANQLVVGCWYLVSLVIFKSGLMPFSTVLVAILKVFGARIGKDVRVKPGIHIRYPWKLIVGDHCWLADCYIDNLDQVTLGKNVCISQQAMLQTGNHDYKQTGFDLITKPIKLEDGVWIGANSLVGPGVTACSHAILTAGSTAFDDLAAFNIYQGNPAKQKRQRIIAAPV